MPRIRILKAAQVDWKARKVGDVLTVDQAVADTLVGAKLAEIVPADTEPATAPAQDEAATAAPSATAASVRRPRGR